MSDDDKKSNEDRPIVVRNTTDLQRLKLEKLMKNPDKPVVIPERPKGRSMPSVPDFVRNVMGSSAGAGSGEFHVYRHLRRKEYARQKFIQEKSEKERLNDEYHQRIEDNKRAAEEKTAKKRAKRQKRRQKAKESRKKPKIEKPQSEISESSENSESEHDTSDKDNTDEYSAREKNVIMMKQEEEEEDCESAENVEPVEKSTELDNNSTKQSDDNVLQENSSNTALEIDENSVTDNN